MNVDQIENALSMQVLGQEVELVDVRIREGRFQRWLALIAGLSSVLAGLEVSYEHYRGSYSNRIMYTPVILSGALAGAGVWGFFNRWAATWLLRSVSAITLVDSVTGFVFHVRGIQRKPGGWRIPVNNVVMGPPVFAPLLFGISGYLGLIASFLQRGPEEQPAGRKRLPAATHSGHWASRLGQAHQNIGWSQDLREGRFQKHLAVATAFSVFFSGFEALYSHYKNRFRYKVQWSPIIITPLLMGASIGAIKSRKVAHTLLPAVSALALLDGSVGFFYHARGVLRRPAGLKKPIYNILYGPPIFAPLLFAASGFLGLLAEPYAQGEKPMNENRRPIDPVTRRPLPVRLQPGYYPGYETLSQQKYWDEATRSLVLERVNHVPALRFFSTEEAQLMAAICDRIVPQDDRDASRHIPIVPRIDERLSTNRIDGYRFEGMPSDQDAYHLGLRAIEEAAQHLHACAFTGLGPLEQDMILKSMHDGKPVAAESIWQKMPVHRFWTLLVQDCVEAYYAHPWAWDEVGFGGPAYPRGYMRLERGEPEPWEVDEQRYEWEAPPQSASSLFEPVGGMEGHTPPQGQGGTH